MARPYESGFTRYGTTGRALREHAANEKKRFACTRRRGFLEPSSL